MTAPAERLATFKRRRKAIKSQDAPLGLRRTELGLTLADVADAIGVSESFICNLEQGHRNPSLARAKQIARFYGMSVEELWP